MASIILQDGRECWGFYGERDFLHSLSEIRFQARYQCLFCSLDDHIEIILKVP